MSQLIESGVMIMKMGYAWGVIDADGRSTSYGWCLPVLGEIYDPQATLRPEDVVHENSPYRGELQTGKLMSVERRTELIIKGGV